MPFWETVKLALDSMRGNAFRAARQSWLLY